MIHNVDPQFTQWDVGRSVKVSDSNATHVHFANQGDAKAVIIELVEGSAKVPDYLLQTGKNLLAYEVLNGVTLERRSFPVRKRERPENYVYEDDHRNYIYEWITNAEKAAEAANLATQNANEAAEKAIQAANSWVMIGDASGERIVVSDAIDQNFAGFRIYGKTTQNGVPTPDAPVELVSVGDSGSITVNVTGESNAQSMTIATPNGLLGIPVTSGGNYTDSNGQHWICDEIDLARGVHVQRCASMVIDGNGFVGFGQHSNGQYYCTQEAYGVIMLDGNATKMVLSDRYEASTWTNQNNRAYCIGRTMVLTDNRFINQETAIAILQEEKPKCMYVLATPIETPLSAEALAAYAALHTYRGRTDISNDAGAWMKCEYFMDAKKYINSLLAGAIVPATVE